MKLLTLRFKNLNSLYGEWLIDFSEPAFTQEGLFAITGPTGSGKSTLLDAICLALYGRTPRLKVISKSTNEIMARQTADCFAEVTFESPAGRFRCHWSQSRARKKVDGALQETKHELADVNSGKIIESRKKEVAQAIEVYTGMDFDRFTRSVLLAQGRFADFLQASADERSPILEQITGTEIYSEISKQVHERQKIEQAKLSLLEAESAGISLLTDSEQRALSTALQQQIEHVQTYHAQQQPLLQAIQWQTELSRLTSECNQLQPQLASAQQALTQFAPQQQQLNRALLAAELESDYREVTIVAKQQREEQRAFTQLTDELPALTDRATQCGAIVLAANTALQQLKQQQQQLLPVLKQVRALDVKLQSGQQQRVEQQLAQQRLAAQLQKQQTIKLQLMQQLSQLVTDKQAVTRYLNEHQQDEGLNNQLTGMSEQLKALARLDKAILMQSEQLCQLQQTVHGAQHNLQQQTQQQQKLSEAISLRERQIATTGKALVDVLAGRLLREYQQEREGLFKQQLLLVKIEQLETERQQLRDNQPCPLCGALIHPYAAGNIPQLSEVDQTLARLDQLLMQAQLHEQVIAGDQRQLLQLYEQQQHVNQQVSQLQSILTADEARLLAKQQQLAEQRTVRQQEAERLQTLLASWQVRVSIEQLAEVLPHVTARAQQWQQAKDRLIRYEEQQNVLTYQQQQAQTLIEHWQADQVQKQLELEQLQLIARQQLAERQTLFADKIADNEEQLLHSQLLTAEQHAQQSQQAYLQAKEGVTRSQVQHQKLQESITNRALALSQLTQQLRQNWQCRGFQDEADFTTSLLSLAQRQLLQQQANALTATHQQLTLQLNDSQQRLQREQQKQLTQASSAELQQAISQLEQQLNQATELMGSLKQRLTAAEQAKGRFTQQQQQIALQSQELNRWLNLHHLIGSADGKKYRNFAQGLTFDVMVTQANQQLVKMSDRYLLVRNHHQPLELDVVDNYQAGEIRSTKNLSGGESFIVSLALALGLSKMASQKVRVDSLFLDEGFGTLDDEALEQALETLASLPQEGKLIGVISHVAALKERIALQLSVIPEAGGHSVLKGRGVRQITAK